MATRREWLEDVAMDIIAEGHEPSFYQLQRELQDAGASHSEANETILRLRGSGSIATTFSGRFVLPGARRRRGGRRGGGGGGHAIGIVASLLAIVAAGLGIWEIGARNGIIPGPGPFQIVFPSGLVMPSFGPNGNGGVPDIKTGPDLAAPTIGISGNCDAGYTISWSTVDGAERYEVRENGHFRKTVTGTQEFIPPNEVMNDLRITVKATALLSDDSPESNAVVASECAAAGVTRAAASPGGR